VCSPIAIRNSGALGMSWVISWFRMESKATPNLPPSESAGELVKPVGPYPSKETGEPAMHLTKRPQIAPAPASALGEGSIDPHGFAWRKARRL
jgi:hypothetical protein